VLKVPAVTPGLQLLLDPALNPDKDVVAVFGIRERAFNGKNFDGSGQRSGPCEAAGVFKSLQPAFLSRIRIRFQCNSLEYHSPG